MPTIDSFNLSPAMMVAFVNVCAATPEPERCAVAALQDECAMALLDQQPVQHAGLSFLRSSSHIYIGVGRSTPNRIDSRVQHHNANFQKLA